MKSTNVLLAVCIFACLFVVPPSHALIMSQTFAGVITEGSGLGVGPGDTVYGSATFNTDNIIMQQPAMYGLFYNHRLFNDIEGGWTGSFMPSNPGGTGDNTVISSFQLEFWIGDGHWDEGDWVDPYSEYALVSGFYGTSNFDRVDYHSEGFPADGMGWQLQVDRNEFWLRDNVSAEGGSMYGRFEIATSNTVPEPATMLLLGSGFFGLAVIGRKRFKK